MNKRRAWLQSLLPVDALIILFLCAIGIWLLFRVTAITDGIYIALANLAGSAAIVLIAIRGEHPQHKTVRFIHQWYPVLIIFIIFKEVYVIIQSLGLRDWDNLLILCDRFLFHTDPTMWIMNFSSPLITELLQIAYVSYYLLMLTVGVELYVRKQDKNFTFTIFTITYGFMLSYIGYMLLPAVGPRFTLHDFDNLNVELPGVFLTKYLRDFINSGESIPMHVSNPIAFAQRDAFPSGHTQMTLIVIYLAHKFNIRSRWWLYTFGSLLIISTVYLRYHYVTDLLGGAVFMIFTVWTAPKLISWWNGQIGRETTAPASLSS